MREFKMFNCLQQYVLFLSIIFNLQRISNSSNIWWRWTHLKLFIAYFFTGLSQSSLQKRDISAPIYVLMSVVCWCVCSTVYITSQSIMLKLLNINYSINASSRCICFYSQASWPMMSYLDRKSSRGIQTRASRSTHLQWISAMYFWEFRTAIGLIEETAKTQTMPARSAIFSVLSYWIY